MTKWYQITAKKNKAKILIYEQIGENWFGEGVSAKKFVSELDALDVDSIELHINCPGGSVFDGTSIYNALKNHKATVDVTIDGIAASIASVVAMAGDTVTMPHNALMMIHDPSALVQGTAGDMLKMIEALTRVKAGMVDAYLSRSMLIASEISDMMTAETWMTADEAVDQGFADKTTSPVKMAAHFEALSNFNNVPDSIMGKKMKKKETIPMKITLDLIKSEHPEIVTAILETVDLDFIRSNHAQAVETLQAEAAVQGADTERARIQAVKAQLIPGHEALIEELMFDGQTSGEQAAVKVLAAEKKTRAAASANNQADAPPVLKQPAVDDGGGAPPDDNLPLAERCKAKWDKDGKLRDEFDDDFEAYQAYEKAIAKGQVRELGKK